jgi:4-amino-4-deoxy-L-arabinose transferase-like glycosyltransferase
MYQWLIYLHVFAVLCFLLAHGVEAAVMLQMRKAAEPEKVFAMFEALSDLTLMRVLLGIVVGTGLLAGALGPWWNRAWFWLAIVVLLLITLAMRRWGAGYYTLVEDAATAVHAERQADPTATSAMERFAAARASWEPIWMTVIGVGGLAVILWLMIFKPF